MVLVKHRKYEDFAITNASSLTASAASPQLLISHAAQGGNEATFLRARVQAYFSVAVSLSDAPPEAWWPATRFLLMAWWSDSGSTVIGPSFGTSPHFLGSRMLRPVLTVSPSAPATDYTVVFSADQDLVLETARKGSGASLPHFGVGLALYDPFSALDGTFTTISVDCVGHLFTLWGAAT